MAILHKRSNVGKEKIIIESKVIGKQFISTSSAASKEIIE